VFLKKWLEKRMDILAVKDAHKNMKKRFFYWNRYLTAFKEKYRSRM
jgi:hypothetical protein